MTLTFGSLFAGIGGLDLGLERAGMVCKWQVEIDPFCQKVLAKHWPDVARYEDVRDVGGHNLEPVDLICGGFPCQPHSVAGKRRGAADDRNLWPEYLRIVTELRPRWVLGENVPGIISNAYIDTVLADLEAQGYACGTFGIPAVAFDAPHRRQRIWIVANAISGGRRESGQRGGVGRIQEWTPNLSMSAAESDTRALAYAYDKRLEGQEPARRYGRESRLLAECSWWATEPDVGRVADGVPDRVDRLRSLGNAVVPQVAEWIGRRIVEANG